MEILRGLFRQNCREFGKGYDALTSLILCILYKQRDATYTMYFTIIISALHVSGGFSAHHQEPIKLYVQPWVL